MDRRNFLAGILASAAVPAFAKDEIKDTLKDDKAPKFVRAMVSSTDSGTYPKRQGDKCWVYLIPDSHWAITEQGNYISKRNLTLL